jgi:hypothetical protein
MIKITYSTVDGFCKTRQFKTLGRARTYAHHWLGETPEVGRYYAVSGDGVGKVTVDGATLDDLFPKLSLMLSHPRRHFVSYEQMQGDPGDEDYFDYIDNMRQADAAQQDHERDAASHRDLWELPF